MRAPPPERRLRALAAASLALVLVVLAASALLRQSSAELGSLLPVVRGVHRVSASLAALLILAVGWLAWRSGQRGLAAAIVAVTAGLSILGAATGISPPPAAGAGNLLGGLLLAGLLAFLLGRPGKSNNTYLLVLVALQVCLGAWIAVFAEELWTWVLFAHAVLGIALAAAAAWFSLKLEAPGERLLGLGLALAVPAAGFAAALFELPLAATLAHAIATALFVAAAAWFHARFA
jgi:heme A synthase